MDCASFRSAYPKWWSQGPVDNRYPPQHAEWNAHGDGCLSCRRWCREEYCRHRGIVPEQHCCLEMATAISHPVETLHQGRNRVLDWSSVANEYYVPISQDGYKATRILYCPWCGVLLPHSRRADWYERLLRLGYSDPGEEDIPDAFNSDAWWRDA